MPYTILSSSSELKDQILALSKEASVFLLTDSNVEKLYIDPLSGLDAFPRLTIPAGEQNKTLQTAAAVWEWLSQGNATRDAVLICAGGGVITDIGGFCASTFKRGIRHINVSTTLLGAVDASIGGKTGIDFCGLKNQIGTFSDALHTFVPLDALETLPKSEILSGYGEMLKTALIADEYLWHALSSECISDGIEVLKDSVERCLEIKSEVTQADPTEKGLRKILNFGHTAGHAFESFLLEKGTPQPHGVCVAHGIQTALILSRLHLGMDALPSQVFGRILREDFPALPLTCDDNPRLLELMLSDKKCTRKGMVDFVLLNAVGNPRWGVSLTPEEILPALELRNEI